VLEDRASGAVTVVGGKLTTYRQMAEDAVDVVAARPGVAAGPCRTTKLPLVGAQKPGTSPAAGVPARLVRCYGAEAAEIAELAGDRRELLEPLAPGLPALGVELLAATQREGALGADDVLDRRTRLGLVPAWREAAAPALEQLLEVLV
jgi:glycerol-3-phosphate dehydrogenase